MSSDFDSELKSLEKNFNSWSTNPEPIEGLQRLLVLLNDLDTLEESESQILVTKLPSLLKALLKCRTMQSPEALDTTGEILSKVLLLLPQLHGNAKYLEALCVVSKATNLWYTSGQLLSHDEPSAVPPEPQPVTHTEWRAGLAVGATIDAIKVDPEFNRKSWSKAKIAAIEGDDISIEFEGEGSAYNRTLNRNSNELAPADSNRDEDWREQLTIGSQVDAYNDQKSFYHSTVVDIRTVDNDTGTQTKEALIGYRIYDPNGLKSDEQRKFNGRSSKHDEWISVGSPRLALYKTFGKPWVNPKKITSEIDPVDDTNDLVVKDDFAFCMARSTKKNNFYYLRNLNRFGMADGFNFVIQRVQDPEIPFEELHSLVAFFGEISPFLHFNTRALINSLKEAVFERLLQSPASSIRDFDNAKMTTIYTNLGLLLKRTAMNSQEKSAVLEDFKLEVSLRCFKSEYQNRRIQGLKAIQDSVKRARMSTQTVSIKPAAMADWLKVNEIISDVYGPKGHQQLIKRTSDILRLLLEQEKVDVNDLENIWAATERHDTEAKLLTYKTLEDVSSTLKSDHLQFLVNKVQQISNENLILQQISLLSKLAQHPEYRETTNMPAELLWEICIAEETIPAVSDLALNNFCTLTKTCQELRQNSVSVLIKCVEKIRSNTSTRKSLVVIEKLLDNLPKIPIPDSPINLDTVIEQLVEEHHLFEAFFDNIRVFKETSTELGDDPSAMQTVKLSENATYCEHIQSRLDFLHFFLKISVYSLLENHMNDLWNQFYETAKCQQEVDLFLNWLNLSTESQSEGNLVFDPVGLSNFFKAKIANADEDFTETTQDRFKVFKALFLLVNASQGNIQQVPKPKTTSYVTLSSKKATQEDEFLYLIKTDPFQLEGADCLWSIVLQANNDDVQSDVIEFINYIYENLDSELDIITIRTNFIEKFLGYVDSMSDTNSRAHSLALLKTFVEASEKRGTGQLKSHSAMCKGILHSLNINNNITYKHKSHKSEIPKKFELFVYSNTTIWEIKCMIAEKAHSFPDLIKLTRLVPKVKEITDSENGKTLNELRVSQSEKFSVSQRPSKKPQAILITPEGALLPKAEAVFKKIYHTFAEKENEMSPDAAALFYTGATGNSCKGSDMLIKGFMDQHGSNGNLTEAEFLEFYRAACVSKLQVVWQNLWAFYYGNDLARYDDPVDNEVNVEELPRFLLTKKKEYLTTLFKAIEDPKIANVAWSLIIKLPTEENLYQKILNLNGELPELLDRSSVHKFLYTLQIIAVLIDESEDPDEQAQRQKWKKMFIEKGGFQYILQILMSNWDTNCDFEMSILDNVLKLTSYFILTSFATSEPEIYNAVALVRRASSSGVHKEQETEENQPDRVPMLERQTTVELAESLIDGIDFPMLQEKLIIIVCQIIQLDDVDADQSRIADLALDLWISSVLYMPNLMIAFYSMNSGLASAEFILKGLTTAKDVYIRRKVCNSITQIAKVDLIGEKHPRVFFLEILEANIPDTYFDSKKVDYSQFFEVFCNLIEHDSESLNYTNLRDKVLELIQNHPCSERRNKSTCDRVLVGLINLLAMIFEKFPQLKEIDAEIVQKLYNDLLFPVKQDFADSVYSADKLEDNEQAPKCKTQESRGAAYRMFGTLAKDNPQVLDVLISGIKRNKEDLECVTSWKHDPSNLTRSVHGYAGIRNLGNICYMNSIIQQLFMIPQFRYSILNADDKIPPMTDPNSKEPVLDDNLLHQFQRYFGFLELTESQYYNPKDFCLSFKDWDGIPVNTAIQQDANEFIINFFQKLEGSLMETPYKHLLNDVFNLQTKNLTTCQGDCGKVRHSSEPNLFISLDIARNRSLEAALKEFTAGQMIEDYMCDTCDKRVNIVKNNYFDQLPNVMILHLKRFDFNFDTFVNEKINSRVEFPHSLNVLPYHIDSTIKGDHNPEDYEYELVGIVVHRGTAQAGHYYSYIRHRLPDGTADPEKWFEFNDSNITVFDSQNIESDCFGGANTNSTSSIGGLNAEDNRKSAYCLFYEKKKTHDVRMINESTGEEEKRAYSDHQKFVPDRIFQEVLKSNEKYMFEKHMYSADYFKFLIDILGNTEYQPETLAKLGTDYAIEVVAHSSESKQLGELMTLVKSLYAKSDSA